MLKSPENHDQKCSVQDSHKRMEKFRSKGLLCLLLNLARV
ncbi:unnamed protein product [Larinioides sclopetarius]|uniref:Uncharacterized protein n=1 Tax=Larinioides sclopetarius TaxID=280406 RepID=A0AAV1YTE4_9ARAC